MAGGLPMGAVLHDARRSPTRCSRGTMARRSVAARSSRTSRTTCSTACTTRSSSRTSTKEGKWLGEQLLKIKQRSPKVRAVRGRGFMWGVDVTDPAKDVVARAMEAGAAHRLGGRPHAAAASAARDDARGPQDRASRSSRRRSADVERVRSEMLRTRSVPAAARARRGPRLT